MLRTGKVIARKEGFVEVCFERPEACAKCGGCEGGKHVSNVVIPGDAPVGSYVAVEMPEKQVLKASILAYVIPLCMLLLGLALGMLILKDEGLSALAGLGSMALSWFVMRMIDKKVANRKNWQPQIIAVHKEGE